MAAPVLGLAGGSRRQGGPEAWGRGAVGQSDRPGTFRVRQGTVFFAAVTLAVAAFWSPLSPPLSQNSPGISPPAGRPRRPPHRWPRGGVCAEDRSGSASNKTPQPHGQLLRLSGRRRTEPQFFHSSPGERAASFVFAFCVLFLQKPCSGPACADGCLLRHEQVFEGRSRCEKQRIPPFCRFLAANFVLLSNFGKSLPLSTVVFAFQKRTSDNIFDSNMLLKHVSARISIMWVQKAFLGECGR